MKKTWKVLIERAFIYFVLIVVAAIIILPVAYFVSLSFKSQVEVRDPEKLIFTPTLDSYEYAIVDKDVFVYIKNSAIVAILSTVIAISVGFFAAYALVRFTFMGKDQVSSWIVSVRMIPPVAGIIPIFLIMKNLMLLDTVLSLILVHAAFNLPFAVWMMMGYLVDIPKDFEEAAMVDGCTRSKALFYILMPLIKGGLVATAIFVFILSWNEFMMARVMTATPASQTVPVITAGLLGYRMINWALASAMGVMTTAPVLIFAIILQKHLIKGMTLGVVK